VKYFNRKYDRIGTLWAGRYSAIPVESSTYWLSCLRYVEQNPVRARMVESPEDYLWSSYRAHVFGDSYHWLADHEVLLGLGTTAATRRAAYKALCTTPVADQELFQQRYQGSELRPCTTTEPHLVSDSESDLESDSESDYGRPKASRTFPVRDPNAP
jgi:hypothetical protein